jgi:hypothetical protein
LDDAPVLAGFGASRVTADKFVSGRYYSTSENTGFGLALTAATRAVPFFVPVATAFDRIGIQVTTDSTAGGLGRLAIYTMTDSNSDALVVDSGTFLIDTTGVKELTIVETLQPGWYVLAFTQDQSCSIRGATLTANYGRTSLATTGPFSVLSSGTNYVSGGFPATLSLTPSQVTTTLFIALRAT